MSEVSKSTGPGFGALPPPPPSLPSAKGTKGKVQLLMEKQMEEMFRKLPDAYFETPMEGKPIVRTFETLLPAHKGNLLNLIPIEQEVSPDTPLINSVIVEKQEHDLENISKNPIYRHPNLQVFFSPPWAVPTLDPEGVKGELDQLTQRVSVIMKAVNYSPKDESPGALLRDPVKMAELLTSYSFAEVLRSDASALFRSKNHIFNLISERVNELILAYTTVKQVIREGPIQPPLAGNTLIHDLSQILASLPQASTAEDFKKLCLAAIDASCKLEVERNTLIKYVCKYLKSQRESIAPFLTLEPAEELLAGPAFKEEGEWITQIINQEKMMVPVIYLIEKTKQFLAPYLSGEITRENENIARGDLKSRILPEFHKEFKEAGVLSDAELEQCLLNVYLKIAAQGVDLNVLEETRDFHIREGEEAKRTGKPKAAMLHFKRANTSQDEIERQKTKFIKGLEHSLKIDFRNLNLNPKQITWLALYTLYSPQEPLPSDWMERASSE